MVCLSITAFALLFVAGHEPITSITGAWVGRFAMPRESDRESNRYQSWTLQLNKDGTFTAHLEMHIMVNIVEDDQGTYTLSGTDLRLKGTSKDTMDDGYKKDTNSGQVDYRFKWEKNGKLRVVSGGFWLYPGSKIQIVFWRAGAVPTPAPPVRDQKAVAILQKVEGVYAALKSYKDEGTFKTPGPESNDWSVVFSTRFSRSNAFRFESTMWERGRASEHDAVWSKGPKAWASRSLEGGSPYAGRLEDCLRNEADRIGVEALLIPHLLAPTEFARTLSKAYPGVRLKRLERLRGRECSVIELSNPDEEMLLTIWVDNASHLILQASPFGSAKIVYRPVANVQLSGKDLAGHAVPPGKAKPHHLAPRGSEGLP